MRPNLWINPFQSYYMFPFLGFTLDSKSGVWTSAIVIVLYCDYRTLWCYKRHIKPA